MGESTPSLEVWYYAVNGQRFGPLNREQLRDLIVGGQITAETTVWTAGLSGWNPAGHVQALSELFAPSASAAPPPPPPVRNRTGPFPALLSPAQKRRRIFFLIGAGFAVIAMCLPWGYAYVGGGAAGHVGYGGVVIGARFWQATVCMVLGLIALAIAIVDLAVVNGGWIWPLTKWGHLGLFSGLVLFSLLGVLLPLAGWHGGLGWSWSVIPIASVIVLALSVAGLILAILECRGGR